MPSLNLHFYTVHQHLTNDTHLAAITTLCALQTFVLLLFIIMAGVAFVRSSW